MISFLKFSLCYHEQESPIHRALFWVAISVLQLDEISLYAAGLALLEQNLHTLNSQGIFDKTVSKIVQYNDVVLIVSTSDYRRCYDGDERTT